MIVEAAQRHRDRQVRWVPHRSVFTPADYSVDGIPERRAKAFIERHHYSRSFPAARYCAGLWRNLPTGSELCGVAVISVPMNNTAVPKYLGVPSNDGAELGRLVLLDSAAFNAESWFVARVLRLIRIDKPSIRGLISYSDPAERRSAAGDVVKRGHIGGVYQSLSAVHLGRSAARRLLLDREGRVLSPRAISKIRNAECGMDYAIQQLLDAGAEMRRPYEDPAAWLERVLPTFSAMRHPGNFIYAWGLDRATREWLGPPNPSAYPKIRL